VTDSAPGKRFDLIPLRRLDPKREDARLGDGHLQLGTQDIAFVPDAEGRALLHPDFRQNRLRAQSHLHRGGLVVPVRAAHRLIFVLRGLRVRAGKVGDVDRRDASLFLGLHQNRFGGGHRKVAPLPLHAFSRQHTQLCRVRQTAAGALKADRQCNGPDLRLFENRRQQPRHRLKAPRREALRRHRDHDHAGRHFQSQLTNLALRHRVHGPRLDIYHAGAQERQRRHIAIDDGSLFPGVADARAEGHAEPARPRRQHACDTALPALRRTGELGDVDARHIQLSRRQQDLHLALETSKAGPRETCRPNRILLRCLARLIAQHVRPRPIHLEDRPRAVNRHPGQPVIREGHERGLGRVVRFQKPENSAPFRLKVDRPFHRRHIKTAFVPRRNFDGRALRTDPNAAYAVRERARRLRRDGNRLLRTLLNIRLPVRDHGYDSDRSRRNKQGSRTRKSGIPRRRRFDHKRKFAVNRLANALPFMSARPAHDAANPDDHGQNRQNQRRQASREPSAFGLRGRHAQARQSQRHPYFLAKEQRHQQEPKPQGCAVDDHAQRPAGQPRRDQRDRQLQGRLARQIGCAVKTARARGLPVVHGKPPRRLDEIGRQVPLRAINTDFVSRFHNPTRERDGRLRQHRRLKLGCARALRPLEGIRDLDSHGAVRIPRTLDRHQQAAVGLLCRKLAPRAVVVGHLPNRPEDRVGRQFERKVLAHRILHRVHRFRHALAVAGDLCREGQIVRDLTDQPLRRVGRHLQGRRMRLPHILVRADDGSRHRRGIARRNLITPDPDQRLRHVAALFQLQARARRDRDKPHLAFRLDHLDLADLQIAASVIQRPIICDEQGVVPDHPAHEPDRAHVALALPRVDVRTRNVERRDARRNAERQTLHGRTADMARHRRRHIDHALAK